MKNNDDRYLVLRTKTLLNSNVNRIIHNVVLKIIETRFPATYKKPW